MTVEAGPGPSPCSGCREPVPGYDRKRRGGSMWIPASSPRGSRRTSPCMSCPIHRIKQIAVPWAEPGRQFTAWFERLAVDWLRECLVKGAAGCCASPRMRAGVSRSEPSPAGSAAAPGTSSRTSVWMRGPSQSGIGTSPLWLILSAGGCPIWPKTGSKRVGMASWAR